MSYIYFYLWVRVRECCYHAAGGRIGQWRPVAVIIWPDMKITC